MFIRRFTCSMLFCYAMHFISTPTYADSASDLSDSNQVFTIEVTDRPDAIANYQYDIVNRALAVTEEAHGNATLKIYPRDMSGARIIKELERGKVDISINTVNFGGISEKIDSNHYLAYFGLMGLRKLLINSDDKSKYDSQDWTSEGLSQLNVGQGEFWPENRIYQSAGINVIEAIDIQNLFPMLKANRFDYIPLAAIEIESILDVYPKLTEDLSIVDSMYIYYPMINYINTTKTKPELLGRITHGLHILVKTGELKEIFTQHFSKFLENINHKATLVVVHHPDLSAAGNKYIADRVVEMFFPEISKVVYVEQPKNSLGLKAAK